MFNLIFQSATSNILYLGVLGFTVPLLMLVVNVYAMAIELLFLESKKSSSMLFKYLGDISYLFPLTVIFIIS
jgi:hypothetical protein